MKFDIDSKRLGEKIKGKFSDYEFQVGILDNKPHRPALPKERGLKS
jgi:hypothetical protein